VTELRTARLVLRPLAPTDASWLHETFNYPAVRRWLWDDRMVAAEEVEEILAESRRRIRDDGTGLWVAREGVARVGFSGFWPFHDALFDALDRDGFLSPERVREIADASGIPSDRVAAAERDTERIAQVRADIEAASASGIPREPSLFINGLFASGLSPYEALHERVEDESERVQSATHSDKIGIR